MQAPVHLVGAPHRIEPDPLQISLVRLFDRGEHTGVIPIQREPRRPGSISVVSRRDHQLVPDDLADQAPVPEVGGQRNHVRSVHIGAELDPDLVRLFRSLERRVPPEIDRSPAQKPIDAQIRRNPHSLPQSLLHGAQILFGHDQLHQLQHRIAARLFRHARPGRLRSDPPPRIDRLDPVDVGRIGAHHRTGLVGPHAAEVGPPSILDRDDIAVEMLRRRLLPPHQRAAVGRLDTQIDHGRTERGKGIERGEVDPRQTDVSGGAREAHLEDRIAGGDAAAQIE